MSDVLNGEYSTRLAKQAYTANTAELVKEINESAKADSTVKLRGCTVYKRYPLNETVKERAKRRGKADE